MLLFQIYAQKTVSANVVLWMGVNTSMEEDIVNIIATGMDTVELVRNMSVRILKTVLLARTLVRNVDEMLNYFTYYNINCLFGLHIQTFELLQKCKQFSN